ncbi:hypothetical protein LTR66_003854 [Elasticomyces elasticus]|nr:hypothetical protein LTR66_003854 [Elasticomyces elasticus]
MFQLRQVAARQAASVLRTARPLQGARRANSSYQPPTPPPSASNPHRDFYKTFGRPMGKVFLGALFTYQVLYWTWLKMESLEIREDKAGQSRTTAMIGLRSQIWSITDAHKQRKSRRLKRN